MAELTTIAEGLNDRVVTDVQQIVAAATAADGVAPLSPAVGFGFSSAPPTPQIVAVTTTIDMPG